MRLSETIHVMVTGLQLAILTTAIADQPVPSESQDSHEDAFATIGGDDFVPMSRF